MGGIGFFGGDKEQICGNCPRGPRGYVPDYTFLFHTVPGCHTVVVALIMHRERYAVCILVRFRECTARMPISLLLSLTH